MSGSKRSLKHKHKFREFIHGYSGKHIRDRAAEEYTKLGFTVKVYETKERGRYSVWHLDAYK